MELKDITNLDLQGDIIFNHFEMMNHKKRQENYERFAKHKTKKQSLWISMLKLFKR